MDLTQSTSSSVDTSPHWIRITSHGKIRPWVTYALKFFQVTRSSLFASLDTDTIQENPTRPLVFHTLPVQPGVEALAVNERDKLCDQECHQHHDAPDGPSNAENKCTATIPRLISVVEIIKREHAKQHSKPNAAAEVTASLSSATPILHQYNEVGTLEDQKAQNRQADDTNIIQPDRTDSILQALEGTSPKIKRTPFMKVTLSLRQLPKAEIGKATYQLPPPPKGLSKAAQHRAKKRAKKKASQPINEDGSPAVQSEPQSPTTHSD
ncbi:hypothetical protein FRC02_011789 [Tulasnella sp. 418]|nr:hypothetical protein FRC02_011789 [Tulasnella sp. 418]